MPNIDRGRGGNAIITTPTGDRGMRPNPGITRGLQEIAQVMGGIGNARINADQQAQDAADRKAEQLAAATAVEQRRQAEAAQAQKEREAIKRAEDAARVVAGNRVNEIDLAIGETESVLAGELKAGKIKPQDFVSKMQAQADKAIAELGKDVPESARTQFDLSVGNMRTRLIERGRSTLGKHQDDTMLAELDKGGELLQRQAVKDLPSALRQADGLYGPDGPYAGILGAKKAQEQGQRFREGATRTHYLNRVTGAHNSAKDLGLLRAEISKNSDLDPNQQSTLLSSIDSRTAVLQSKADAWSARNEKKVTAAFDALAKFDERGLPASPAFAAQTMALLKGTQYEGAAKEILSGSAQNAGFGAKPLADQRTILEGAVAQAKAQGATPESIKRLDRLQRMHEGKARDYEKDPWAAAAERGDIDAVPPIDISNPANVAKAMGDRMALAEVLDQQVGRTVSPLRPDEATALTQAISSMAPTDQATMLGQLRQQVGPERMAALSAQMSERDPTIAIAAAAEATDQRTSGGESVGSLVLAGREALKNKLVKIDEGLNREFFDALGDAIRDPNAKREAINAAVQIYAAKEASGNGISVEEALQAVTGSIAEHAGQRTLAPSGWDADKFERAIESITPETLASQFAGPLVVAGSPITPEQIAGQLEDVRLIAVGDGRYSMQIGQNLVTTAERRPAYIRLADPGEAPSIGDRIRKWLGQ